jgi:hypothetical protein
MPESLARFAAGLLEEGGEFGREFAPEAQLANPAPGEDQRSAKIIVRPLQRRERAFSCTSWPSPEIVARARGFSQGKNLQFLVSFVAPKPYKDV